jgi:hypothetical protein
MRNQVQVPPQRLPDGGHDGLHGARRQAGERRFVGRRPDGQTGLGIDVLSCCADSQGARMRSFLGSCSGAHDGCRSFRPGSFGKLSGWGTAGPLGPHDP